MHQKRLADGVDPGSYSISGGTNWAALVGLEAVGGVGFMKHEHGIKGG